jgi:hypothetical protein
MGERSAGAPRSTKLTMPNPVDAPFILRSNARKRAARVPYPKSSVERW